jgi:hypothetical protein
MDFRRHWKTILLGAIALAVLAQVVRPSLTNPPLSAEPHWDSPRTRELVVGACFDCHSNRVHYPWYSQVAPVRWWIWHHVTEGREHLNFSEPDSDLDVDDLVDAIRSGEMPTPDYRWMHPRSRLSRAQQDTLVLGLIRTFEPDGDSSLAAAPVDTLFLPTR